MELSSFAQIGLIIGIATLASLIAYGLKQPLIIAYVISGAIIGPAFLNLVHATDLITTFSEIGVIFLLFIVGLHLNPKIIKDIGGVAIFTGATQVLLTSFLGFVISRLLGFSEMTSIYLGISIAFASTIIVIKFLSDKRQLETLYGRLSIGHLLVQDVIAVFLLLAVSSISTNISLPAFAADFAIKLSISVILVALVSRFLFPKILPRIAKSPELLFIFSIGWLFVLTALFQRFNISIEIGALIAGISFSMLPYHVEIESKIRPLRDFFIILFFIFLGSQINFETVTPYLIPAAVFSLFILLLNPFIIFALLSFVGYKKRTSFLAAISMTQLSEFSLILVGLGVKLGHIQGEILSFITLVALITIAASAYLNYHTEKIFSKVNGFLKPFERKETRVRKGGHRENVFDSVLFGFNRVGYDFVKTFQKIGAKPLVVDYNPVIVRKLEEKRIPVTYGDAADIELLEEINWKKVSMALSTISDPETNLLLIHFVKEQNPKCIIVVLTSTVKNAIELYEAGANYVMLPHLLSAKQTIRMIKKFGFNLECFVQEKIQHLEHLKKLQYEF